MYWDMASVTIHRLLTIIIPKTRIVIFWVTFNISSLQKEDAKAGPVISNDAKAQKAQKPSHEDKRDFKNHHKKREFKHNQAKLDLDQMENFHKRHHGNKFDMHPNDVRMIRKGKMSREMLVDRDLPEAEITKRMMKLMKKRAKHQMRNHSHQKRRDQKRRLKENAP